MIKGDNNVYLVDGGFTAEYSKTLNELEQESATANVNQ